MRTFDERRAERTLAFWTASIGIFAALYIAAFTAAGGARGQGTTELFLNDNLMAAFLLLGIFTALEIRSRSPRLGNAAAFCCGAGFILTRSLAGSLGLAAGLAALLTRGSPRRRFWAGAAFAGLAGAAAWVSPWRGDSLADRLEWWKAAARMIWERPFFGWGPGSYERMSGFFHDGRLKSLFAHSFPLETAAELGVPAMVFLLAACFRRAAAMDKRFIRAGLIAVAVQSLFDFSLNVPGVFALFLAGIALGSPRPEDGPRAMPARRILAWAAAGTLLAAGAAWHWGARPWLAFLRSFEAESAYSEGRLREAETAMRRAARLDPLPGRYHAGLARILEESGRTDEAVRSQAEALRRDPARSDYQRRLKEMLKP